MGLATTIARDFFGDAPTSVTQIDGLGSVNQVFLATLGPQKIVVRLPSADDLWRAEAFYAKERWCLEQAALLEISSPRVLAQGTCDGWPYLILSAIDGVNGSVACIETLALWQRLGEYAARFHGVSLTGFGENLTDFLALDGERRWQAWIAYNRDSLSQSDPLLALGVYAPKDRTKLLACFTRLAMLTIKLGLVHGDLSPRNVLVNSDGEITLLDWGCAEAHLVPHYEILALQANTDSEACVAAFFDGYGLTASDCEALLAEVADLAVLKALDLTRWAIDRCPTRIEELAQKARRVVEAMA